MLHQHPDLGAQMPIGRINCPDAFIRWLVFGEDRDEVPTGNPGIDVIVGQLHDADALARRIEQRLPAVGVDAGIRRQAHTSIALSGSLFPLCTNLDAW